MSKSSCYSRCWGWALLLIVIGVIPASAAPHTPDSPEVRAIVDRAVDYLRGVSAKDKALHGYGREALIGYAMLKADVPKEDPRIQLAVKVVVDTIAKGLLGGSNGDSGVYSAALSAIFLLEVDDQLFAPQIEHCLARVKSQQRPNGGFSYTNTQLPDISQTQYAILCFWLADKHGFEVDPQIGKAALEYLELNQSPNGGFSYQGTSGDNRVTPSMSAAGGGSLYIAGSWLGYGADAENVSRRPEEKGLPPSVRLVMLDKNGKPIDRKRKNGEAKVALDEGRLRGAESRAEGLLTRNFSVQVQQWQYYYLYGYERFASFLEASKGISDPEPDWYNQGVEFMKATQRQDGSFPDEKDETEAPDVSTALAVLFLVRSTKKSLGDGIYSDGRLLGGQGLSDEAKTVMQGGRVVSLAVGRSVDDMKGLLSQTGGDADFGQLDSVDLLTIDDSSPDIRDRQLATIRNLVAHQNPKLRWLAVRALGNYQDLENMPPLIYALTDPEKQIVEFANRSLMQIARKFDDQKFTLPDSFEPNDNNVEELRKRWVEFYFTVQPNGDLYRPSIQ